MPVSGQSRNAQLGCLLAAVDAYAEQLTGDAHALWAGIS
jgi:hypothetical protein